MMRWKIYILSAVICLAFFAGVCPAWIGSETGTSPGFWKARVVVVCVFDDDGSKGTSTLTIKRRLAADIDVPDKLIVSTKQIGDPATALTQVRYRQGDWGVVCLERSPAAWHIVTVGLDFMPTGCGVFVAKSADDPAYGRLCASLRAVRLEYLRQEDALRERRTSPSASTRPTKRLN